MNRVKKKKKETILNMKRKSKYDKYVRVVAFDPSIKNMGYSVLDYNPVKNETYIVTTGLIQGQVVLKTDKSKGINKPFDKRFKILDGIYDESLVILNKYKPEYVISESAFYQRFVTAFAALSLVIYQLQKASRDYNGKDIFTVAPRQTKMDIAGNGAADKTEIRHALVNNKNLRLVITKNIIIDKLSLDETDSIAHGLYFINKILPNIILNKK